MTNVDGLEDFHRAGVQEVEVVSVLSFGDDGLSLRNVHALHGVHDHLSRVFVEVA